MYPSSNSGRIFLNQSYFLKVQYYQCTERKCVYYDYNEQNSNAYIIPKKTESIITRWFWQQLSNQSLTDFLIQAISYLWQLIKTIARPI